MFLGYSGSTCRRSSSKLQIFTVFPILTTIMTGTFLQSVGTRALLESCREVELTPEGRLESFEAGLAPSAEVEEPPGLEYVWCTYHKKRQVSVNRGSFLVDARRRALLFGVYLY